MIIKVCRESVEALNTYANNIENLSRNLIFDSTTFKNSFKSYEDELGPCADYLINIISLVDKSLDIGQETMRIMPNVLREKAEIIRQDLEMDK